jgi:hypothetical protein
LNISCFHIVCRHFSNFVRFFHFCPGILVIEIFYYD